MEHGSVTDSTASTFSIMEEDHTLANSARFVLNQDPRVAFCGYSIPHPADKKINIRVQTTGTMTWHIMLTFWCFLWSLSNILKAEAVVSICSSLNSYLVNLQNHIHCPPAIFYNNVQYLT